VLPASGLYRSTALDTGGFDDGDDASIVRCRIVKASFLALGLLAASPAATAFAQDLEGTHPEDSGRITIR
jgi:hypothetical protein